MPRPIETLLSLPRVRLANRVPILETERLIRQTRARMEYQPKLVKSALEVSSGSAHQFSLDDIGLSTLLEELNNAQYVVTRRSKKILEDMLNGICGDGFIFKEFEKEIQPLFPISRTLRSVSEFADDLADKTKEESLDVARALLLDLPKHNPEPTTA